MRRLFVSLVVVLVLLAGGPLAGPADAIVNGSLVTPERHASEWPWSVAIRFLVPDDGTLLPGCTGSLIAPAWVLTAAHCTDAFTDTTDLRVVHGAPDVYDGTQYEIDQVISDPLYAGTPNHDVGLLHLTADPGPPYAPLALGFTAPNAIVTGLPLEIAGWGVAGVGLSMDTEREGTAVLSGFGVGALGSSPNPSTACYGDSGGPVVGVLADGRRAQIGVTSEGDEGCVEYDVDADLRYVAGFILSHVGALPDTAPTVNNETLTGLVEDGPGSSMDVLANDSDPDGDTLTVVAASAFNGTGSCTSDGTCDFTPASDVNTDTAPSGIRYLVHDGRGGLVGGTMLADVAPQPDPPHVTLIDADVTGPAPFSATVYVTSTDLDGSTIGEMSVTADYGDGSPEESVTVLGYVDPDTVAFATHQYLDLGTYTVTITIEDPDGLTDSASTTVTVLEGPPQFTVADVAVNENAGVANVHAHLSKPATEPVDVTFETIENTVQRDDLAVTDGVLRFDPGVTDVVVPIGITNDNRAEGDEELDVVFAASADSSSVIATVDGTATVVIHDDESPTAPDRVPQLTVPFERYDYEVPMAPGETSTPIALIDPVQARDETGPLPVTCNHALNPGVFALGTTTVNCSATDPTGHTRSASFRVIVRATGDDFGDFDEAPPTIQVGSLTAVEELGPVTAPITMSAPSPQMQFVQIDVLGSPTDLARTRVIRTLLPGQTTDSFTVPLRNDSVAEMDVVPMVANGFGTPSVSGTLTIVDGDVDKNAPVVTLHAERYLALLPVSAALPVPLDYGPALAIDEHDGVLGTVCTPPPGSSFAKGTTTARCTATDSTGHTGGALVGVVVKTI